MPSACAPSMCTINVHNYIIITKSLTFGLTFCDIICKEKYNKDLKVILAENYNYYIEKVKCYFQAYIGVLTVLYCIFEFEYFILVQALKHC